MPRAFDLCGFSPAYECAIDPEFPGAGEWGLPTVAFSHDGTRVDDFRSRWGTPMIVKVRPHSGPPWVGFFEAGRVGSLDGAFATPDPYELCVVAKGRAYVVNVEDPSTCWVPLLDPIRQVAPGADILVLADFIRLAAVNGFGMRWQSERLCLDWLKILDVVGREIRCEGAFMDASDPEVVDATFVVDATTGKRISGREFIDPFG